MFGVVQIQAEFAVDLVQGLLVDVSVCDVERDLAADGGIAVELEGDLVR
jgi:hypothetical protein